jgi:hypothetical protein
MTQPRDHTALDNTALDSAAYDALAGIAAALDDGPDALDVPDIPDPDTDRDPQPRADDGPQNVDQRPIPTEEV